VRLGQQLTAQDKVLALEDRLDLLQIIEAAQDFGPWTGFDQPWLQ